MLVDEDSQPAPFFRNCAPTGRCRAPVAQFIFEAIFAEERQNKGLDGFAKSLCV